MTLPLMSVLTRCSTPGPQKNNCMGLSAEIPTRPDVQPLLQWRGKAVDWTAAEDIFIGWLAPGGVHKPRQD